jgi:anthranilate phosphoribosyltransferase
METKAYLEQLLSRRDLSGAQMKELFDLIMRGETTTAQNAALLVALRMKGESVEEVAAAASVMRAHARRIDTGAASVVDTCGTGGDGADTFNISTTAAFVVAGAGLTVAKHGNRAVSSKCGSADVLAQLGFNLMVEPVVMEECIQEHGIGFLFAPNMHPAMKHVMPARKELGVRTLFNMLGPLSNPAGATGQVIGVFAPALTEMFAGVLQQLGTRRAFIVHGEDGLDEITVTGTTRVSELRDGRIKTYDLDASHLVGESWDGSDLTGGDAACNAQILRDILAGKEQGARRAVVLVNAAAAIVAGEKADTLEAGLKLATEAIDSGAATEKLEQLLAASQG